MSDEPWGGPWTEEKLRILEAYLAAYLTALKKRRRHLRLGYIDAFAGAGYRRSKEAGANLFTDGPVSEYRAGSARLALQLDPGFDKYVFVEQSKDSLEKLRTYVRENGHEARADLYLGDANEHLCRLAGRDWTTHRAVVFLDPYGAQVEWDTLRALASTEAVDVWILAPIAVGINRLLQQELTAIPDGNKRRLDAFFGTPEWRNRLYESAAERAQRMGEQPGLFGGTPDPDARTKTTTLEQIADFYRERLVTLFPHVAETYRVLRHPKGQQLYALFFAAANPAAGGPALRIANHLLQRL